MADRWDRYLDHPVIRDMVGRLPQPEPFVPAIDTSIEVDDGSPAKSYWDKLSLKHRERIVTQGVCAICGEKNKGKRLAIDHCHQSGKIRGFLCTGCNVALGLMGDSPGRLRRAAEYLESHAEPIQQSA